MRVCLKPERKGAMKLPEGYKILTNGKRWKAVCPSGEELLTATTYEIALIDAIAHSERSGEWVEVEQTEKKG